jgi:hypothetical protein
MTLPEVGLLVVVTANGVEGVTACEPRCGHPLSSALYAGLVPALARMDTEARALGAACAPSRAQPVNPV